jgi:glutathione S-transferase
MQIIGTESSPFTRKVRIVALERGISATFVVDSPLATPSSVAALNPLGKVPVLVRDDGSVLVDSSRIAAWLDTQGEGERLIPQSEPEHSVVLQWETIADGILDAAVLMRMEALRPQGERSSTWVERQRVKVESGMAWMNRGLGERECLIGTRFSYASIAVACCLSYLVFRFAQDDWTGRFVNVAHLRAQLEQRPSFKATVMRG